MRDVKQAQFRLPEQCSTIHFQANAIIDQSESRIPDNHLI